MAESGIITNERIAQDGAVRDFIGKEFDDLANISIPAAEEALTRFAQVLQKTSASMKMPTDLDGLEAYERHIQLVMKTDIQYEKVQQAKLATQAKIEAANKRALKDFEAQEKAAAKEEAAAKKSASAYSQLNDKYKEAARLAKDLAAAIVLKGNATKEEAAASIAASQAANKLNDDLKGIDATIGNAQRNVGNYNDSLGKLAKGLKGLGGLGRILSSAIGIDPEVFMAVQEAGRAIKDVRHASELNEVSTAGHAAAESADTAAIELNTEATEANIAIKEEEAVISNLALGLWGLLGAAVIAGGVAIWSYISAKKEQEEVDKRNIEDAKTILEVQNKLNGIIDEQRKLMIDLMVAKKQMSETDSKIAKDELDRNKEINTSLHENVKARLELMKTHGITADMLDEQGNAKMPQKNMAEIMLSGDTSKDIKNVEDYNKAVEKLNNTTQGQIEAIKKNFLIKASIAKAEEKLNDDDFENMQARIKLLKNETEDKKTQLELQLQYDLNANSERNASLQAKNDEGKIIWENYYKAINALAVEHFKAMKKIADETENETLSERAKAITDQAKDAVNALKNNTNSTKEKGLLHDALSTTNQKFDAEEDQAAAKKQQQEIEANDTITNTEELNAKILLIEQQYNDQLADIDRKRYQELFELEHQDAENRKKIHEQQMKAIKEEAEAVINFAAESLNRKNEYNETEIKNDLAMRQDAILQQQQLASEGLKNTLAFQQAAAAKDELAQQQLAIKKEKDAKAIALFKLLASAADAKDPLGALAEAFAAMGFAGSVAGSYFEGTENVAEDLAGNKVHSGKDGYRIAVDGSERIMTGEQNAMIGDMSNEDLAKLAYKYQMGWIPEYSGGMLVNSNNDELLRALRSLEDTIKGRPVSTTNIDKHGIVSQEMLVNGLKKVVKYKPINNRFT